MRQILIFVAGLGWGLALVVIIVVAIIAALIFQGSEGAAFGRRTIST